MPRITACMNKNRWKLSSLCGRAQSYRRRRRNPVSLCLSKAFRTFWRSGPGLSIPRPPTISNESARRGDAAIQILNDFMLLVERISIDEASADLAAAHLLGPPADIASATPEPGAVRAWTSGRGRRRAHQAPGENHSQVVKPNGPVILDPDSELGFHAAWSRFP